MSHDKICTWNSCATYIEVDFLCHNEKGYVMMYLSEEEVYNNPFYIKKEKLHNAIDLEVIGAKIYDKALSLGLKEFYLENNLTDEQIVYLANGMLLKSYQFNRYKQVEKQVLTVHIKCVNKNVKAIFDQEKKLTESVFLARNLIHTPSNHLTPALYSDIIVHNLAHSTIKVEVLNKESIKGLDMNLLLSVAQASDVGKEPRVVIMERVVKNPQKTVVLIGKGLTFDTGGISLKPSNNMNEMICDMSGSAAVVGFFHHMSKMPHLYEEDTHYVGLVGLVENNIGPNATNPGDIVKTMNGKTVEILNTDAEGRLVLADLINYANKHYKAAEIVTIATLTGAIGVALGEEYAGLFTNCTDLEKQFIKAGKQCGEKLWPLPLTDKNYNYLIESSVADCKNANSGSDRLAGSIFAAKFLEFFLESHNKFVHLDIAYVIKNKRYALCNTYNGFGVRLLSYCYSQKNIEILYIDDKKPFPSMFSNNCFYINH